MDNNNYPNSNQFGLPFELGQAFHNFLNGMIGAQQDVASTAETHAEEVEMVNGAGVYPQAVGGTDTVAQPSSVAVNHVASVSEAVSIPTDISSPQGTDHLVQDVPMVHAQEIDGSQPGAESDRRGGDLDSMPDLQSVSDSESDSSDRIIEEQEVLHDLQRVVDDDNDSAWTDVDSHGDDAPSAEPFNRGNRRARVEDDHDDDRDRRHPSERAADNPGPPNPPNGPRTNPFMFAGLGNPGLNAHPLVFIPSFFGGPPRTQPQPEAQPTAAPQDGNNHAHDNHHPRNAPFFTTGFAIVLDPLGNPIGQPHVFGGNPRTPSVPPAGSDDGQQQDQRPTPSPGNPMDPPPQGARPENPHFRMLAEFFERFNAGMAMQGMGFEVQEQQDPERAKKLVAGLEEVPLGLLKRMERVGGAPGAYQDSSSGEVEVPGCAVCWDKLLDAEGEGFMPEGIATDAAAAASEGQQFSAEGSSTSSEPEQPKIVALPCAHVFHASCLIPWFCQPRQTTCPTCRFNIDPDNLTYVRRPAQPRRRANTTPAQADRAPTAAAVGTPVEGQTETRGQRPPAPDSVPEMPSAMFTHNLPNAMPMPPFSDNAPALGTDDGRSTGAAGPVPAANGANPHDGGNRPPVGGVFTLNFDFVMPGVGVPQGFVPQGFTFVTPPAATAEQAEQRRRNQDDFFNLFGFPPEGPPIPNGWPPRPHPASSRPREKPEWVPPPPPGPSLRQRIELKERETGLRCDDMSCGIGPSDEDPTPDFPDIVKKQVSIRALKESAHTGTTVCSHTFHPSCLVSAERVAGWGGEEKEEKDSEGVDEVEVSCPVCRALGCVSKEEWEEGVAVLG